MISDLNNAVLDRLVPSDPPKHNHALGVKFTLPIYTLEKPDGIRAFEHALHEAQRELGAQILQLMGNQPHTVQYEVQAHPKLDDYDLARRFTLRAYITSPTAIVVRREVVHTTEKHRCPYCGGLTLDDAVGNCAACGGPRL